MEWWVGVGRELDCDTVAPAFAFSMAALLDASEPLECFLEVVSLHQPKTSLDSGGGIFRNLHWR